MSDRSETLKELRKIAIGFEVWAEEETHYNPPRQLERYHFKLDDRKGTFKRSYTVHKKADFKVPHLISRLKKDYAKYRDKKNQRS